MPVSSLTGPRAPPQAPGEDHALSRGPGARFLGPVFLPREFPISRFTAKLRSLRWPGARRQAWGATEKPGTAAENPEPKLHTQSADLDRAGRPGGSRPRCWDARSPRPRGAVPHPAPGAAAPRSASWAHGTSGAGHVTVGANARDNAEHLVSPTSATAVTKHIANLNKRKNRHYMTREKTGKSSRPWARLWFLRYDNWSTSYHGKNKANWTPSKLKTSLCQRPQQEKQQRTHEQENICESRSSTGLVSRRLTTQYGKQPQRTASTGAKRTFLQRKREGPSGPVPEKTLSPADRRDRRGDARQGAARTAQTAAGAGRAPVRTRTRRSLAPSLGHRPGAQRPGAARGVGLAAPQAAEPQPHATRAARARNAPGARRLVPAPPRTARSPDARCAGRPEHARAVRRRTQGPRSLPFRW